MAKKVFTILFSLSFSAYAFASSQAACYCSPKQTCWPTSTQWNKLRQRLNGQLIKPVSPIAACLKNANSTTCKETLKHITKNPFALQQNPGDSENQGWYKAWNATPSSYAVEASNAHDIAQAVNFARKHNIRLVIKGAGHDYLGRSSAPNSLLIWTAHMQKVTYHKAFTPQGAPTSYKATPAITAGAGARWIQAYTVATTEHGAYVQGGGCTSVGVAGGFTQGGGFGSFSKEYGTGAASILQVKVVTADGKIIIANKYQHPDLFWAIRGGGGGTYGVVAQMTLQVHKLPKYFGLYRSSIKANSDQAYKQLLQKFLTFFASSLDNQHWGEKFNFNKDNTLSIGLVSSGLSPKQVQKIWRPFNHWLQQHVKRYSVTTKPYINIPPRKMWDLHFWLTHYPNLVTPDTDKGARKGEFWFSPDSSQIFKYWYTYQSWWLPARLLTPTHIQKTADVFYKASRLAPIEVHVQKALYGASAAAIKRSKQTSTNPAVYNASALILMAAGSNHVYNGVKGHEPDSKIAQQKVDAINKAMALFKKAAPNAGAYANEADYFEKNWQHDFWGSNYSRLLKIKQKYDPDNLFTCHHCVGSEFIQKHGVCKAPLKR